MVQFRSLVCLYFLFAPEFKYFFNVESKLIKKNVVELEKLVQILWKYGK